MQRGRWTPAVLLAPAGLLFLLLFVLPEGWMLAASLGAPRWSLAEYGLNHPLISNERTMR